MVQEQEVEMNKKSYLAIFMAISICLISSIASAQISNNITHLGRYDHNWDDGVYDLAMRGYYCYMACGNDGLRIAGNIVRLEPGLEDISQLVCQHARAVAVSGNYAYVGSLTEGLLIVDISNPWVPQQVGQIPHQSSHQFSAIRIFGDYAFTCCEPGGLNIIDISNPLNAQIVSSLTTTTDTRDVYVRGNRLYAFCSYDDFQVFDITDITAPQLLSTYCCGNGQWVTGGSISGNYACITCGWDGFRIIDLTTMQAVSSIDSLYYGFRVIADDNYAYVTYGDPECPLAIIDISNPLSPQTLGVYYPPEDIVNFQVVGEQIFAAAFKHGMRQVEISNPARPYQSSFYNNYGHDLDVTIRGNYAIVRDEHELKTIDISDLDNPHLVGRWETRWEYNDLQIIGNRGYLVQEGDSALRVFDLTDPSDPSFLGAFNDDDYAVHCGVAVYGNYAYLVQTNGLDIIDVANPASMTQAGFYSRQLRGGKAIVYGQTLFVQDYDMDLIAFDLFDPLNPNLLGEWPLVQYCENLKAVAGKLYVITSKKLWIFDIAQFGTTPPLCERVLIGDPSGYLRDLDINGNDLYITGDSIGLCVYNVSNPANPVCTGFSLVSGKPLGVSVSGNFAVVANYNNLDFYDCSAASDIDRVEFPLPGKFALLPNYPNPFNNSTQIRFELPAPDHIIISVFDILGRNIGVLADADFEAGRHTILWNGTNSDGQSLASGKYFIQAKSSDIKRNISVLLLK
jgi:hypothetical protein